MDPHSLDTLKEAIIFIPQVDSIQNIPNSKILKDLFTPSRKAYSALKYSFNIVE